MKKNPKNGMSDPTTLKPVDKEHPESVQVVIETPRGSRNKFAFYHAFRQNFL